MQFMMMMKADANYEAGIPPKLELIAAIGELSAELARTGVLVTTGGLLPSAKGARVRASKGAVTVTDGPFAETKELIGGYAIVEAASRAEAIAIARRFVQLHTDVLGSSYEGECEVRAMFDGAGCSAAVPEPALTHTTGE